MKNANLYLVILLLVLLTSIAVQGQALQPAKEELVEDIVAWVNDDVVLFSDLQAQEQMMIQTLMQGKTPAEKVPEEVEKIKAETLLTLIFNRLMVQDAERMFNIEALKDDLLQRFMKSRDIPNVAELDKMLTQVGMERDELLERLMDSAIPEVVIQQQVSDKLAVTEAEALEVYQEKREEYTTQGHVVFREVVILDSSPGGARLQDAEDVIRRAREGVDFVTLVKTYSEAPSKAIEGKIGPVSPSDLVESIAAAVRVLPVGQVSEPLRTKQGWHVIVVEERVEDTVAPFEEVKERCENIVRAKKYKPAFEAYIKEVWDSSTIEVRKGYEDRIREPWSESVTIR